MKGWVLNIIIAFIEEENLSCAPLILLKDIWFFHLHSRIIAKHAPIWLAPFLNHFSTTLEFGSNHFCSRCFLYFACPQIHLPWLLLTAWDLFDDIYITVPFLIIFKKLCMKVIIHVDWVFVFASVLCMQNFWSYLVIKVIWTCWIFCNEVIRFHFISCLYFILLTWSTLNS